MPIFHYISYQFDKILQLKNQFLSDLTSQNHHFSEKSADLTPLIDVYFNVRLQKKYHKAVLKLTKKVDPGSLVAHPKGWFMFVHHC